MEHGHFEVRRLLPTRFGLRTMLLIFAVCATALFVVREFVRVRAAHEQYDRMVRAWQRLQVSAADVTDASKSLMDTEADTAWISNNRALRRHVVRLKLLLDVAELRQDTIMWGSKESRIEECVQIRAEIDKYADDKQSATNN